MLKPEIVDSHFCQQRESEHLSTEVDLYNEGSVDRHLLENYISSKYLQVHDAHLNEYLPLLMGVRDQTGLLGAFGLRPGHYRPMFLEQYLDSPIEQQVSSILKQPVDRCKLVEVGNLAITKKGYGVLVMVLLSLSLAEAGYEWMVFTVTEQVEKLMRRIGFEPYYLAGADPDRLNGDVSRWGSYYTNNPRVMVGNLDLAMKIIRSSSRLSEIEHQQRYNITDIACSLRDYRRLKEA